jgi:hypothetical protein
VVVCTAITGWSCRKLGDMPEHREQSEKSNQECWAAR